MMSDAAGSRATKVCFGCGNRSVVAYGGAFRCRDCGLEEPFSWCSDPLILNVQGAEVEVLVRGADGPYPAAVRLNVSHGDDFVDVELTEEENALALTARGISRYARSRPAWTPLSGG